MSPGEEKAWELIRTLDPAAVCRNAAASFDDHSRSYTLKSFGMDVSVGIAERKLHSSGKDGTLLLERLAYFSRVSILWYLAGARDIPPSGNVVKPENLKGGLTFFRGTHVLPLDRLASIYDNDTDRFLNRAEELGGERAGYGDLSVRLSPLPRVPVVIILRPGDDEFPPGADLLFDCTCEFHLALDVLWAVAMESILIMM